MSWAWVAVELAHLLLLGWVVWLALRGRGGGA